MIFHIVYLTKKLNSIKISENTLINTYTEELFFVVIKTYCSSSPNSMVSNSQAVGNYSSAIGSSVNISCLIGYQANGSMVATCASYNVTKGIWTGATGTCRSKNLKILKKYFYYSRMLCRA